MKVNNGNGLYDNQGLCDSLIADLNGIVKNMAEGQYVNFCMGVSNITKKILNLKKGIADDIKSKDEVIEELKRMLRESGQEVLDGIPAELIDEGGDGVGGNHP